MLSSIGQVTPAIALAAVAAIAKRLDIVDVVGAALVSWCYMIFGPDVLVSCIRTLRNRIPWTIASRTFFVLCQLL
jgi:hypothetical protein